MKVLWRRVCLFSFRTKVAGLAGTQCDVPRDPLQPAGNGRVRPQIGRPSCQGEECRLRRVFGIVVPPENASTDREHQWRMACYQRLKRSTIAHVGIVGDERRVGE